MNNATFRTCQYTRQDAIDDGVYVEMTESVRIHTGLTLPTVITSTLMDVLHKDITSNLTAEEALDLEMIGIAWMDSTVDLLKTAFVEAIKAGDDEKTSESDRVEFKWRDHDIVLHLGPDDVGEPCFTVSLPSD